MATILELQTKGASLQSDLQAVETELTEARGLLQSAVSNPKIEASAAAGLAGRVTILEARRTALRGAIEQNTSDVKRAGDLLNSKEYKAEAKKITEIESFFSSEAEAVRAEMAKLHARLSADFEKYNELHKLVSKSPGMTAQEQSARIRNEDYLYLRDVFLPIDTQAQREAMHASLTSPMKSVTGAGVKNLQKATAFYTPNGG